MQKQPCKCCLLAELPVDVLLDAFVFPGVLCDQFHQTFADPFNFHIQEQIKLSGAGQMRCRWSIWGSLQCPERPGRAAKRI